MTSRPSMLLSAPLRALPGLALVAALGLLGSPEAVAAPMPQETVFAIENAFGTHDLLGVDEVALTMNVLQPKVELLPLKLAGFAKRDRLRLDLPRLADQGGSIAHVRLPELGSLYRYRVPATGDTRLALNRSSGGLAILSNLVGQSSLPSITEWVTVDTSGRFALVATEPAAGGDVLLIDMLFESPWINLTSFIPPLNVEGISLRLAGTRAWFVADDTLYRAELKLSVDAQPVTLPLLAGETLIPETAVSRDGRFLAVVTEDPLGLRRILIAPPSGDGRVLTPVPGDYDPPLYDSPVGPLLALSNDGLRVGFRDQVAGSRELFVQRSLSPEPPKQITKDASFTDTIDNVGILGFTTEGLLIFAAGEGIALGPDAHIEGADFFQINAYGGATEEPLNITQTSGFPTAPFTDYGTLDIFSATADPLNQRLILDVDPDNGDHALVMVSMDGTQGITPLTGPLDEMPVLAPAGDAVQAFTVPAQPAVNASEVHLLPPADGGLPRAELLAGVTGPITLQFARFAVDRAGTRAAFVASAGQGLELPGVVDVAGSAIQAVWNQAMSVSPSMAFTASGRLAVGIGFPGGPYLHLGLDGPGSGVVYPIHPAQGFALEN